MSQPGFVMVVENDENGKERPLAGIVGGWVGLTPTAIDLISRFCHFVNSHDLKSYEDHVVYGIRMMIYAKGSTEDEDLEELEEYYPGEKFDEKVTMNLMVILLVSFCKVLLL